MNVLQQGVTKLTTWIDGRTKRERVILLGIALSVVGALWDQAYVEPWIKGRGEVQTKMVALQGQIDALSKAEVAILSRSREDPDRDNRERKKAYQEEIATIKSQLATSMKDMIDPKEMPAILGQFLRPESGLQLIAMNTEQAVPVVTKQKKVKSKKPGDADEKSTDADADQDGKKSADKSQPGNPAEKSAEKSASSPADALAGGKSGDKPASAASTDKGGGKSADKGDGKSVDKGEKRGEEKARKKSSDVAIYKHGIKIRLRGNYLDVVRYLKSLEGMKWVIFWDSLEYAVGQYPDMTVTLSVYSLSLSRELIGM
ncbi:MAG: hypothetical protein HQL66_04270 [Magnetococcales bacterium]|nr:hypothetical protein [Magnetococcales bacterium]